MSINKNISVWSGSVTPPTKYHLWIKDDGQYIFDGVNWSPIPIKIQLFKDTIKLSATKTQNIYYTYKEEVFETSKSTPTESLTTDVPCTLCWMFYCLNSEQHVTDIIPSPYSLNYMVNFYSDVFEKHITGIISWSGWLDSGRPELAKDSGEFETFIINVSDKDLDIIEEATGIRSAGIYDYSIRAVQMPSVSIEELGQTFHIKGVKYYTDLSACLEYIDRKIDKVKSELQEETNTKFDQLSGNIEQDYIKKSEKGAINGVVPLNSSKLIDSEFLPSYVDDVIEVYASFDKSSSGALENIQLYLDEQKTEPVVGEKGKIYIDLLTNYQFRWSGTIFTPISIPDSSIVDLGQFESETAADNVMLADNTGIIFNSQCLIITYKIGEHRSVIINQYNTGRICQYKHFNGRKYFRYIDHNDTTVTAAQSWQLDNAVNLSYNKNNHILSHTNRYFQQVGTSVTLPLVSSKFDGLMSKKDKGSLDDNTTKISSIWNGNPPLANISLNGTWTIYNQDNTVYQTYTTNPTVEYGYKAKYSGTWKWAPVTNGKPPKTTSGNWDNDLPDSGINSKIFTSLDYVTNNTTYTQTISAPKYGLMVSGSNVVPASGNDSKSASTSITFKHRLYYGAVTSNNPLEDVIKALTSELISTKTKEITNITTTGNQYYCFAYPASLGKLTKITQDGATPVLTAFTLLENINITNAAGLQIAMYVYVSNNVGAFTNNILKFE